VRITNEQPLQVVVNRPDQLARQRVVEPPSIEIAGVRIHRVSAGEAVNHIGNAIAAGAGGWVLTPNLDILRRLRLNREFHALCEGVTLRLADGMPLVWASWLQGTPLKERVAGSDMIWRLCERAATESWRVVFIGGAPGQDGRGAAAAAARKLMENYPGLNVAGTFCPPFGFESDSCYVQDLYCSVTELKPELVFVGLGSPKQEHLIAGLREHVPSAWLLGIGISFSFASGEVRRAPQWMRLAGLEWVHRLKQEPRRLARRYLVDGLPFAVYLLSVSFFARYRLSRSSPCDDDSFKC
jgi:N-acetylglucosaminyldiphosphoundecaprenol N-acetyl-beta-D-mannosaminyltransferase